MRTFTIMSISTEQGTVSLVSRVDESTESALAHLEAMSKAAPVEPVYVTTSGHSWRWTWEYVSMGTRCTDTVRLIP